MQTMAKASLPCNGAREPMRSFQLRSTLFVGMAFIVLATAGANAQTPPARPASPPTAPTASQIIAIRKAVMDLQGGVAVAMKAAVDNEGEIGTLKDGAKALVRSMKLIPTLFPPGTEQSDGTKAKAEIWSDSSGFAKHAQDASAAAQKVLAAIEAGDHGAFDTDFVAMGHTCGACHREYKQKD